MKTSTFMLHANIWSGTTTRINKIIGRIVENVSNVCSESSNAKPKKFKLFPFPVSWTSFLQSSLQKKCQWTVAFRVFYLHESNTFLVLISKLSEASDLSNIWFQSNPLTPLISECQSDINAIDRKFRFETVSGNISSHTHLRYESQDFRFRLAFVHAARHSNTTHYIEYSSAIM